jgi:hypothetical protein
VIDSAGSIVVNSLDGERQQANDQAAAPAVWRQKQTCGRDVPRVSREAADRLQADIFCCLRNPWTGDAEDLTGC